MSRRGRSRLIATPPASDEEYEESYTERELVSTDDEDSIGSVSTDDEDSICSASSITNYLPTVRVPKLTDMASFTVSVALWNHINLFSFVSQSNNAYLRRQKLTLNVHLRETVIKSVAELPVPASIANRLREYVSAVSVALEDWLDYHAKNVFCDKRGRQMYHIFHHIIWYPNGKIDLVRTARNLLNSPRLPDIEKYRLLCTYCLKDELESMWPSLVSNYGVDRVDKSRYPLIHYWNCYFENNLDQIIREEENQSIDSFMFENTDLRNWPAKEYFFDRFTHEEQIRVAISFIAENDAKYQKILLRKLNSAQRLQVYMSSAANIITNYAVNLRRNELDIRSTWFEVRNLITKEDFLAIFRCLLKSKSADSGFLEDIWSSASEDFRSHLINYKGLKMVGCALRLWIKKNDNDFFFKMLSKSATNTKRFITTEPFFIQGCVDLLRDDKFPLLDRLLKFCFIESEELIQFKRGLVKEEVFVSFCKQLILVDKAESLSTLLNVLFQGNDEELAESKQRLSKKKFFQNHCAQLITCLKFDKFDQLLNLFVAKTQQPKFRQHFVSESNNIKYYCLHHYIEGESGCSSINTLLTSLLPSSPDFIAEYKKNLLMSSNGIDWWAARLDSKIDLNPVIIDSLPTRELVTEFKERLVFSPIAVNKFRKWLISGTISEVDACVNRYITSNEDKIALKKRIIGNPVDLMREFFNVNGDRASWLALETWWPRDTPDSVVFKSTLPVNEIFDEMLKDCIFARYDPAHRLGHCKLRSNLRFDSIDRFLEWYFVSSIDITKYKMQRIDAYKEIVAIKTLLKKRDNWYLKKVLNWIFENNSQQIAEFKTKKKADRVILQAMP